MMSTIPSQTTEFETAIGTCAISWTGRGISGVRLPARTAAPSPEVDVLPAQVQAAIEAIRSLLTGAPSDLTWIELDLEGVSAFDRRVAEVARTIRPGQTLTYGEIAASTVRPARLARSVPRSLATAFR